MTAPVDEPIEVLHVDDDPDLGEVVALHLERQHDAIEVETTTDPGAVLEAVEAGEVDCIVSDQDMPEMEGLDVLRAVRDVAPDLPFILFTGKGNEEIASEAISAGVTEYLQKGSGADQYAVLANRIERAVAEYRARTALEESERMLSTLLSNLPGMVYRCTDEEGWPMSFVSEGAKRMSGYEAEEIESGDVVWEQDVIVPDERDRIRQAVESALASDEPFEVSYRIETADGESRRVWERGRAVEEADGGTVLEGFITDITDREGPHPELERYETIIQAVGDPVYTLDADGVLTFVNEALEELSGYDRSAMLGEPASIVMDERDVEHAESLIQELLQGEQEYATFEMELLTAEGQRIPCENHIALLPDDDGEFRGTAGVVRDITERKRREQRLEEFASVVSHDLQSPLSVIQGIVDYAMETGDTSELDRVQDAATRMDELIDELLTLARMGEGAVDREDVDLPAVVERAWRQVTAGDAALEVDVDCTVSADPSRLRELFENLFANALEHGTDGSRPGDGKHDGPGVSRPEAGATDADGATAAGPPLAIRVGETERGFYVADDGQGIPADVRDRVFDRGYSSRRDGTGFGLTIVRNVVESHGWSITVGESEDGGARFDVETV